MQQEVSTSTNKRQIINAIFIPGIIAIVMILSFLLEKGMDWDFHTAGVYPRRIENIWGGIYVGFYSFRLESFN